MANFVKAGNGYFNLDWVVQVYFTREGGVPTSFAAADYVILELAAHPRDRERTEPAAAGERIPNPRHVAVPKASASGLVARLEGMGAAGGGSVPKT